MDNSVEFVKTLLQKTEDDKIMWSKLAGTGETYYRCIVSNLRIEVYNSSVYIGNNIVPISIQQAEKLYNSIQPSIDRRNNMLVQSDMDEVVKKLRGL